MTKQNPDHLCDECKKFDKSMNRNEGVSFDVWTQCRCCEICIKMTDEYLKENTSKKGRVMCPSCYEEIKERVGFVDVTYEPKKSVEGFKVALGRHDFPINYTSTEWEEYARCITSDGRNVNMAEEFNRLEKETLNGVD